MRSGNLQNDKTPCKIPFRKISTACFDFSEREEIEASGKQLMQGKGASPKCGNKTSKTKRPI